MHKPLKNLPVFDAAAFDQSIVGWKDSVPAGSRAIVEWGVGKGPGVFVTPAKDRALGFYVVARDPDRGNDERWADFIEFEFLPSVVQAVQGSGYRSEVFCVDQRPIQVMRARRRLIETAARVRGLTDTEPLTGGRAVTEP